MLLHDVAHDTARQNASLSTPFILWSKAINPHMPTLPPDHRWWRSFLMASRTRNPVSAEFDALASRPVPYGPTPGASNQTKAALPHPRGGATHRGQMP